MLFVDDCFGHKQLLAALKAQEFEVKGFYDLFGKEQNVKDEKIIPQCAKQRLLIVTTDKNMVLRHRDLLKQHKQCVIFTTSNSGGELIVWLYQV